MGALFTASLRVELQLFAMQQSNKWPHIFVMIARRAPTESNFPARSRISSLNSSTHIFDSFSRKNGFLLVVDRTRTDFLLNTHSDWDESDSSLLTSFWVSTIYWGFGIDRRISPLPPFFFFARCSQIF